jgi:hypothetical protein
MVDGGWWMVDGGGGGGGGGVMFVRLAGACMRAVRSDGGMVGEVWCGLGLGWVGGASGLYNLLSRERGPLGFWCIQDE